MARKNRTRILYMKIYFKNGHPKVAVDSLERIHRFHRAKVNNN